MSRRIICTNEDNVQIEFNHTTSSFFLVDCEGIYSITNNVVTSDNTMIDGATYQGSTTKKRNIVITAEMDENYQENRDFLYKTFKPKGTGSFVYIEDEVMKTIDYKVESVTIEGNGVVKEVTISLLCMNPFFTDVNDTIVEMASWQSNFEFEHEFMEEGEEFASRVAEIIKKVDNDSAAENIGVTITFTAEGIVVNPAIYHIESGDFIKVNISLSRGDKIIITTHTNNKAVKQVIDGVTTEINELLDEESEFLQLQHGANTLKYDALVGLENMNVEVAYRFKYLGV